jgi:hypothetical protein
LDIYYQHMMGWDNTSNELEEVFQGFGFDIKVVEVE